jgi:hypothetical protein
VKGAAMSLKDTIDEGIESLKKAGENIKDAISEAGHRSAAEGEEAKRNVAGDVMSPADKAGSLLNETKESVLADVDKVKQDLRNDP